MTYATSIKSIKSVLFLFAALGLLLSASVVSAEGGQCDREGRGGACREEVKAICGDIEKGKGHRKQVKECIDANLSSFSTTCQEKFAERKAKHEERRQQFEAACGGDVQNYCADAEGRRGVKRCMRENRENLSNTCQEFLETQKGKRRGKRGKGRRGSEE